VARTSRQQRRQRRGVAAGTPPLQPARPQKAAAEARETALDNTEPRAASPVSPSESGSRGFPGVRFIQEAIAELKKVEWPTQQQVVSGTAVVIVACLLVGVYLYANDRLWGYLVQHVLLR
jgi:preprotein translocase subunit SecE